MLFTPSSTTKIFKSDLEVPLLGQFARGKGTEAEMNKEKQFRQDYKTAIIKNAAGTLVKVGTYALIISFPSRTREILL